MQQMLRDPVIQNTRLMPMPDDEEAGSREGEGQGEESENPLVGITITQADKVQPIKVCTIVHSKWTVLTYCFMNELFFSLEAKRMVTVKMHQLLRYTQSYVNCLHVVHYLSYLHVLSSNLIFTPVHRVTVIRLGLAFLMTSLLTMRRWTMKRRRMKNRCL